MAQTQQNISIQAPSFQGINTEDSPLTQDATFSSRANNAVIDEFGRIGARKGFNNFLNFYDFSQITPPAHDTYEVTVGAMHHSAGFFPVCVVEVDWLTAGSVTATTHHVAVVEMNTQTLIVCDHVGTAQSNVGDTSMRGHFATFGDQVYLFSDTHSALEITPNATEVRVLKDQPGFLPPQDDSGNLTNGDLHADIVCSAYGRLWVSGVDGDHQKIWYSDLEDARVWYDGKAVPTDSLNTAGGLEVSQYWPSGKDDIINIRAHNNMLVVFGRHSILFYGNPTGDPAAIGGIYLQDAIDGMGLVSRDAVCSTGNDLLFVDDTGVRSLGRSVQEQSVPVGDLTANVRQDFAYFVQQTEDLATISLSYWPQEGITVANFPANKKAFVMDMKKFSQTGGARITTWTEHVWDRALFVEDGVKDRVLLGSINGTGIKEYRGYVDNETDTYRFSYQSNPLTFGDSVRQKFPKRMDLTIVTRDQPTTAYARWGSETLEYQKILDIDSQIVGLWGEAQFGNSTYGQSADTIKRYRVNTKGSGAFVTLGVDADINGGVFSLQEINIQTLLGRIY